MSTVFLPGAIVVFLLSLVLNVIGIGNFWEPNVFMGGIGFGIGMTAATYALLFGWRGMGHMYRRMTQ